MYLSVSRFGFGATTATPATGGLFGNTQQAGSSLFPQQTMQGGLFNNPAGGFGAQATGTAHVKYSPLVGIDVVYKRGASPSVNIKHHCITCMKEYENKSLEELRLEDYTAGRKGAAGGVLGFSQPEAKPMFGATSTFGAPATTSAPSVFGTPSLGAAPFGQTSGFGAQATGTAHVKYSPLVGIDVVYKRGASQSVNIKHHCITCMKEYENKSLEELRLEDYTAGRKGAAGGVLGFSQPEAKPMFWATSTFGAPATTSAPSVFGTPSLGAAPRWPRKAQRRVISTSLFGAPASTQASTLGTNTASFGFGSNLQTQVRGPEVSVSMSRGNPATTGFGAVGGLLDNKPMQSAPTTFGAQPGTSLFGAPASTQASTLGTNTASFGFGSNLQTQNTSDMFGAKAATTGFGAVGGLLGNKPAQSAPTTFGAQPAVGSMAGGFGTATSSSGLLGGADFGKPALVLSASASALASRTSCTGGTPNNLPPLGFHSIHGKNVRISRDGSTARHVESFCKGVAISARPVRVNEKVCIRFVEISNSRSFGVICFGFTTHDPATLAYSLPKNEWIDQANKPGIWAEALGERFCEKDNVLYFYVNYAGDVHFGVNGEEKGLFFSGVDTRNPLWALVGIYGKYTAVQFADPRVPTQVRVANHSPVEDERLVSSLRSLSVEEPLPAPRYQNPLVPLSLHQTKGRNVQFVNDRGVAARSITELCQGYVFTARPMCPGQTIVIQILATEAAYAGSLAIGLTSCNPWFLRVCDLPEDAELLLDRPEYWVVKRDAANGLRRGDELAVTLTLDGQVRVSRNGSNPVTVMHVDHTLRLWAFVDIYGATQKVRMLSSQLAQSPQQVRVQGAPLAAGAGGTELVVSLPPQGAGQNAANQMTLASAHYIEPIQSSQLCLSTVPMTNQPTCSVPPYPRPCSSREGQCLSSQNSQNEQVRDTPNGDCRELRAGSGHDKLPIPAPSTSRQIPHQSIYSVIGDGNLTGTECTICYENPIDSVLYMCGHMCMCYRCAVQQWTGKGSGKCPLCRAQIKDVIRTYKS